MHRKGIHTKTALGGLLLVLALLTWNQAHAGPITGGYGNAPFTKLGVYQGLITVTPGAGADILEIGNAGRDIASTGSIFLRPTGVVYINPQVTVACGGGGQPACEGGELDLQGAGGYQSWAVDLIQNQFRIHTNGAVRLAIDGTVGSNIYVPTGSLCFGNVGDNSKCINGPSGGAQNLDSVLGVGNNTTKSAALGAAISPSSKLVVNNGTSSTGGAGDSISAYANTTGSAIYAQQNNISGWAGYFSGNVNIAGTLFVNGNPLTYGCYVTNQSIPFGSIGSPAGINYNNNWSYYTGSSNSTGVAVKDSAIINPCNAPKWVDNTNVTCQQVYQACNGSFKCQPGDALFCPSGWHCVGTTSVYNTPTYYQYCAS